MSTARIGDMTEPERTRLMADISLAVDAKLPPHTFYTLHLFGSESKSAIEVYTSRCNLRNMAKALRRTADKLDQRHDELHKQGLA